MDKQLLKALENLGDALELLAATVQSKKEAKSDTAQTIVAGDFGKSLEQINNGIKSIKKDTKKILKNQQTIIALQKKKDSDKKTEPIDEAGDPKKTSSLKKGIATILLIAVAVLAIGLAFKIVGKIDFLSVISLGIGMFMVSMAFERIAKLDINLKRGALAVGFMVLAAVGFWLSSKFLSRVSTISIGQLMATIAIAGLFYFVLPVMTTMMNSMMEPTTVILPNGLKIKTKRLDMGKLVATAIFLPILMLTMSMGIWLASRVLSGVKPLSMGQIITSILIAGMFSIAGESLVAMMNSLHRSKMGIGKMIVTSLMLPIIMVAMSIGIVLSSWVLGSIKPIGMAQAFTAILISLVFVAISFGLNKIVTAINNVKNPIKTAFGMILLLPAIALGITASSYILSLVKPISFSQAITAILIGAMFAVVSFGMGKIVKAIGKLKSWSDVFKLPVFLTLISLAIAASAIIFSTTRKYFDAIDWMLALKILVLGVIVGIIAIVAAVALKIMKGVSWKQILQLPVLYTLLAVAVAISAWVFFKFRKEIDEMTWVRSLRILIFGVVIGIITLVAAFVGKVIGNMSWATVLKIPVMFTLISTAVALAAWVMYKFRKEIDALTINRIIKIALFGVALGIAALAVGLTMVLLKKIGLGIGDAIKGGLVIVIISAAIMLSSLILNLGDYKKYPSLRWTLGVAASLAAFGIGALLLGTQTMNPFFYAGLGIILLVAATIVGTSLILGLGEYKKYPSLRWSLGVGAAIGGFGLAAIILGTQAINPFFYAGLGVTLLVASTIVEVSKILQKGKYSNPGMVSWAMATALLYAAFTPLIILLGAIGVMGDVIKFFGGSDPFEKGRKMLAQIAYSIVDVSVILQKGKYTGGPTKAWAEGIAISLGAFAPVYGMLVKNAILKSMTNKGGVGPDDFAKAIKTVSLGIVTAATYFSKFKGAFKNGPPKAWAEGVGLAIGAFAPVYQMLVNAAIMKQMKGSEDIGPKAFSKAIETVSLGIITAATLFEKNKAKFKEGNYPSKAWGEGVGGALRAFAPVFKALSEETGLFTSGSQVIWNMVKGIKAIASAIVSVAKKFSSKDLRWDSYPTKKWSWNLKLSIGSFVRLSKSLEDFDLNLANKSIKVAQKMSHVAKILSDNNKYFKTNIPKGFVLKMALDLLTFQSFVNTLVKMEKSKSVGESISDSFNAAIGKDPVTQIARKLITLSKGYDALSKSLMKLSVALRSLNLKTLTELGSVTRGLVSGKDPGEEVRQVRTTPVKTVGRQDDGSPITGRQVKENKAPSENDKKNSLIYVSQQLEKMNKILSSIDKNSESINKFLEEQATKGIVLDSDESGQTT